MSLPVWLFDELADHLVDNAELDARATAWGDLLDGAEEVDRSEWLISPQEIGRSEAGEPTVTFTRHLEGPPGRWVQVTVTMRIRTAEFLLRLREIKRAARIGTPAFDVQQHTGFWPQVVPTPEPDESVYVKPKTAAVITGLSMSRLAALRRRGKLRSIGMTAGEYKQARALAGWGDDAGWGSGVWYLREDVERLAREKWRAT